jgi:ribonuclease P protein component
VVVADCVSLIMTSTDPPPFPAASRERFPKGARLLTKREFDAVYQQRCKASDGTLLIFAARNRLDRPRLGLSVSRKVGPAVVRNRLKRWLREAFRSQRAELPSGVDLIVIPQGVERAGFANYRESLLRLSRKLLRKLPAESPDARTDGGGTA